MAQDDHFTELLSRVRGGDSQAALELVRNYESAIRVAVRTRLSDARLRRQFDSMDVCQSVLASFFVRAATGAYDLNEPGQLVALLTKMAQNKFGMRARGEFRQRRDARRLSSSTIEECGAVSSAPGPSRRAEDRDLLLRALEMMSLEVRAIAVRRMRGEAWQQIAGALGGTADARRKQFERAVEGIADRLDVALER
jgi:RNA polymerase sigma-70 factor (ECF subfamily)